jgi:Flp pilus assembly protein TadD
MGFRFYKRINLGGGVHLNLSKTGVGISAGIPGARYSVHSSGRTVKTVGLPGTGLYHRTDTYAKKGGARPRAAARRPAPAAPVVAMVPRAGVFAPKEEKAFVRGVTAYMKGGYEDAIGELRQVMRLDPSQAHVSEELFAGMCLIGLGRSEEAVPMFEAIVASHQEIPDQLMAKFHITGVLTIPITQWMAATVPMSSLGASLMLAELYQHTGRSNDAIELLESLGSLTGAPAFALSLAELYEGADRHDDVLRVTEDYTANTDDLTAHLLAFRASALSSKGLHDAALQTLKEALRFRSRDAAIMRLSRYVRAHVYEQMGQKAKAKRDLERIYAEDPQFLDVEALLGLTTTERVPARPDV